MEHGAPDGTSSDEECIMRYHRQRPLTAAGLEVVPVPAPDVVAAASLHAHPEVA